MELFKAIYPRKSSIHYAPKLSETIFAQFSQQRACKQNINPLNAGGSICNITSRSAYRVYFCFVRYSTISNDFWPKQH